MRSEAQMTVFGNAKGCEHDKYWTTILGNCMACQVDKLQAQLAEANGRAKEKSKIAADFIQISERLTTERDRLHIENESLQRKVQSLGRDAQNFMEQRDKANATIVEAEKEHDEEIGEFQIKVKELLDTETGSNVDGAGCDSGDWRDFTLSEISQGLAVVTDQSDQLRTELAAAKNRGSYREMGEVVAELDSLRKELATEKAAVANYASKCVCVFCRTEFLKTDVDGLTNHIMSCDKSPLVELVAQAKTLNEKFAAELTEQAARAERLAEDVVELNQRNIDMRAAYEAKDVRQVEEIRRLKAELNMRGDRGNGGSEATGK